MRVYKQKKFPLHLRWELYPVKHEPGKKAKYGGSYMEEADWWQRKRKKSLLNELKFMAPEILLLQGLRKENPRLWNVSFPFHLGLYLAIGTLFLLFLGAGAMVFGLEAAPGKGSILSTLYYLTILVGFIALTSGTAGSLALLQRRMRTPELRNYSGISDYLNLLLIMFFFLTCLMAWLFHDHAFDGARAYLYSLLTFGRSPAGATLELTFWGRLAVIFSSVLIAYLPFTHMSHMFMKYFMYHSVKWEDTPNVNSGDMEAAILQNLGLKPTWAAPHVGADGNKAWADIAAPPKEEGK